MTFFTGHRLGRLIADRTGQPALGHDADVVGRVLPFRVSSHVADELVDWARAPDDPLYRLVMPHRDMLAPADFAAVEQTLRDGDRDRLRLVVDGLRERLDPHPGRRRHSDGGGGGGGGVGGGLHPSVAEDDGGGGAGGGIRHPYPETLLVRPRQGRRCHSLCAACFRWPRFSGDPVRRRASGGPEAMTARLARHPEITDVLLAGGDPLDPLDPLDLLDPLTMRTDLLDTYVTPLLDLPRIRTIRIATQAVSFRPERFLDAPDADDLLRLLERVVASGRHLSLLLHVSHPRELHPEAARRALRRLRATGAVLRTQGAVVRHVNDDAGVWARMWREQAALGLVPHRMSVERDTGPRRYFGLPLARALEVYAEAVERVSGAGARAGAGSVAGAGPVGTVCGGPVMTTELGRLAVDGIVQLQDGPAFALRALRARDPALVGTVAHARFDPAAQWWDDLIPYGPRDRTLIPGKPLTVEDVVG